MSEIVRQGYFECSPKGELFQAVRTYMKEAVDVIPVLQKRMKKQGEFAEKKMAMMALEARELTDENKRIEEERQKFEKQWQDARDRLDYLEGKIPLLEEEARNCRGKASALEGKVDKKEAELSQVRTDREKLQRDLAFQMELTDGLSKQLQEAHAALAGKTNALEALNLEIEQLKRKCEDLENAPPPVAIPHEKSLRDAQTQTKSHAKAPRVPVPSIAPEVKPVIADFQSLKNDYHACVDGTEGLSYEQFNRLKNSILARFGKGTSDPNRIIQADAGNFAVDGCDQTDARLFAHSLMSRIMDHACRSVSRREATCQTLSRIPPMVSVETAAHPTDFPKPGFRDAFTKLLDPRYSDRPPRTFEWILKSLRSIFDEKTVKDATDIREGREVSPMPEFTLQWSTRQYGLSYLSHQCCWDLVNSARAHRDKALEIELFRRFLDTDYSASQLTFFLRIRANCLRRGLTVTTRKTDSDETYSEAFLTSSTAIEVVRKLFERAGKDVIDITVRELRDEFVRRPSPTLDASMSYVPVSALCHRCVEAFGKYELLELRKMLQCMQITPKLDGKQFNRLVKELVPSISDQAVGELFRIMNAAHPNKVTVKQGKFKRQFRARSLLNPESANEFNSIGLPSPELDRAREKWAKLQPILDEVLETTERGENPGITHAVQCLRAEMDQVSASLTCSDVVGVHTHMLAAIMGWQSLRWAQSEPDPEFMDTVTNSIRGILHL
jgi:hypothetical protein